jgi:hypothetical protein
MGNDADLPLSEAPFEIDMAYETDSEDMPAHAEDVIVATVLAEEDSEALEQGIALVFDSIRAEEAANEDEPVEPTYALLEELNRIWAQAA